MTFNSLSIFLGIAAIAIAVVAANFLSERLLRRTIPIPITNQDGVKTTRRILFLTSLVCIFLVEALCYFIICKTETVVLPAPNHPIISSPAPLTVEHPQGRLTAESSRQERHALLLEEETQLVRARFEHWPLTELPVLPEKQKPKQVVVKPPPAKPERDKQKQKNPPVEPKRKKELHDTPRQRSDVKRYILGKMDEGDRYVFKIAMNTTEDNQSWTSKTTGIYYQVNMIKKHGVCQYAVSAIINRQKYSYREPAFRCR
jgi:hypothetical protein